MRPSMEELNRPRTDIEVGADVVVALLNTRWLKVPNVMRLTELAADAQVPMAEIRKAFIRRDMGVRLQFDGKTVEDTGKVAAFAPLEVAAEIIDLATLREARGRVPDPVPDPPALAAVPEPEPVPEPVVTWKPSKYPAVTEKRRRAALGLGPKPTSHKKGQGMSADGLQKFCNLCHNFRSVTEFKLKTSAHPEKGYRFACEECFIPWQRDRYLSVVERKAFMLYVNFTVKAEDACVGDTCPGCSQSIEVGDSAVMVATNVRHEGCGNLPG